MRYVLHGCVWLSKTNLDSPIETVNPYMFIYIVYPDNDRFVVQKVLPGCDIRVTAIKEGNEDKTLRLVWTLLHHHIIKCVTFEDKVAITS